MPKAGQNKEEKEGKEDEWCFQDMPLHYIS